MKGRGDLNQALQEHLLRLRSYQPKTFPGLVRRKELTGTIVVEAFPKRALGPIEFHPPASRVKLTLYVPIIEPLQIEISAGWFFMGSDAFQEVEGPVHRVWVNCFAMAPTQVTVAEYARFLDASGTMPPPFRDDANFSHPQQPVVAVSWFDAVAYCAWLSSATGSHYRLPTRLSGNELRAVAPKAKFPWGDDPPMSRPGYHARWKNGPEPVGQSEPNAYGLFESAKTYMSGVAIGLQPTTTKAHRIEIRRGRKRAPEKLRVEVLGGTRSRSRDARLAPASARIQIRGLWLSGRAKQMTLCLALWLYSE